MSISLEEQIHQRRANLADLKALGIDVYPRAFARTHTIAALVDAYGQRTHDELEAERIETVTSGRILGIRAFGKANFLVLSDGRASAPPAIGCIIGVSTSRYPRAVMKSRIAAMMRLRVSNTRRESGLTIKSRYL